MKEEYLFQAHRYLDGELADGERGEFEEIMRNQPELARYVMQISNLDEFLKTAPAVQAPQVEIPRGILQRVADLLTVRWRVPAAPVLLTFLFLAALVLWRNIPAGEPLSGHSINNVKFVYFSKTAKSVSIVGSFNGWDQEIKLYPMGDNGYWVVKLPISPGEYSYSFLVDGKTRIADPTADSFKEDDFGSRDSILRVGV